jgi:hypothetical protein
MEHPVPCLAYWSLPSSKDSADFELIMHTPPSGLLPLASVVNIQKLEEDGNMFQIKIKAPKLKHSKAKEQGAFSALSFSSKVSFDNSGSFSSEAEVFCFKSDSKEKTDAWLAKLIECFSKHLKSTSLAMGYFGSARIHTSSKFITPVKTLPFSRDHSQSAGAPGSEEHESESEEAAGSHVTPDAESRRCLRKIHAETRFMQSLWRIIISYSESCKEEMKFGETGALRLLFNMQKTDLGVIQFMFKTLLKPDPENEPELLLESILKKCDTNTLYSAFDEILKKHESDSWKYSIWFLWYHCQLRLRLLHICRNPLRCTRCASALSSFEEFILSRFGDPIRFNTHVKEALLRILIIPPSDEKAFRNLANEEEQSYKKVHNLELWKLFLRCSAKCGEKVRRECILDIHNLLSQSAANIRSLAAQPDWQDFVWDLFMVSFKEEINSNYALNLVGSMLLVSFFEFSSMRFQSLLNGLYKSAYCAHQRNFEVTSSYSLHCFRALLISFLNILINSRRYPVRLNLRKAADGSGEVWQSVMFMSSFCRKFVFASADWVQVLKFESPDDQSEQAGLARSDSNSSISENESLDKRKARYRLRSGSKSLAIPEITEIKLEEDIIKPYYGLHPDWKDDNKFNDMIVLQKICKLYQTLHIDTPNPSVAIGVSSDEWDAYNKFNTDYRILCDSLKFLSLFNSDQGDPFSEPATSVLCRKFCTARDATARSKLTKRLSTRKSEFESSSRVKALISVFENQA